MHLQEKQKSCSLFLIVTFFFSFFFLMSPGYGDSSVSRCLQKTLNPVGKIGIHTATLVSPNIVLTTSSVFPSEERQSKYVKFNSHSKPYKLFHLNNTPFRIKAVYFGSAQEKPTPINDWAIVILKDVPTVKTSPVYYPTVNQYYARINASPFEGLRVLSNIFNTTEEHTCTINVRPSYNFWLPGTDCPVSGKYNMTTFFEGAPLFDQRVITNENRLLLLGMFASDEVIIPLSKFSEKLRYVYDPFNVAQDLLKH